MPRLVDVVAKAYRAKAYTSTQEQAWMLLAARALAEEIGNAELSVNGERHKGQLIRAVTPDEVAAGALTIVNEGDAPIDAVVSVIGAALTPEPAISKGFTIERTYYTLDGKKIDLASATGGASQLEQNARMVVVLKVEAPETGGRILLVDRLPAGLEIENPRLVDGGDVKTLDWLKTSVKPQHTEFRDDRFVAAFDFFGSGDRPARPALCRRRRGEPRARERGNGRLPGARGDAGLLRAPGRHGGGHVPPRPLRPHRLRPPRRDGEGVRARGDRRAQ